MTVNIANLYPDILNMYGDKGNISALCYRMKKRGISVCVTDYAPGEKIDFKTTDIVYIGGGSDKDQINALHSLSSQREELKEYVENGGCLVAVCTGYELLGKSFHADGKAHKGLGILDIEFNSKKERMIGDIVIESDLINEKIAGFENHSGYASNNGYSPLGKVLSGYGSDVKAATEGTVYKNLIASFIHGPLLPVNPLLTDYIISAATKKFGEVKLSPLDDDYETKARNAVLNRNIK